MVAELTMDLADGHVGPREAVCAAAGRERGRGLGKVVPLVFSGLDMRSGLPAGWAWLNGRLPLPWFCLNRHPTSSATPWPLIEIREPSHIREPLATSSVRVRASNPSYRGALA